MIEKLIKYAKKDMGKVLSLWRDSFIHITLIYVSYMGILKWAGYGVHWMEI